MHLTLGKKLFLYTSGVLLSLLLLTLPVLERGQAQQWEEHLRSQHIAFARFATPEILKRFRGNFPGASTADVSAMHQMLGFNTDLISFAIYSPGGRQLFQSGAFPGFEGWELTSEITEVAEHLQARRLTSRTIEKGLQERVLEVTTPGYGASGAQLLTIRYLFSFRSVDQRLAEMHRAFLTIAFVAAIISLLLVALVARRVTRPLDQLKAGVRAIARGELKTSIEYRGSDEIAMLAQAFNEMAASLASSRDELTNKNEQLTSANEELQNIQERLLRSERLAAVGQLAAGVSHEIDNPVGIILGYAELLLEDLDPENPQAEDIQAIIDECIRCKKITGGLLGLARVGTQQWESVSLNSLIHETVASLRPQKLFRLLEVEVELEEDLPEIRGDADRLRQILVNLLLNSAQALQDQGKIRVTLEQLDGNAIIEIQDSGPGIPESQMEQIFEPFFSTKGKGEGTGLGLSVCRKLVEEHGGLLMAESSSLGGALLRVSLPMGSVLESE